MMSVNQQESSLVIPMQMVIKQPNMLPLIMVETVMNVSVINQTMHSQQQVDIVILAISSVMIKKNVKLSPKIVEPISNIPTIT